MVEGGWLAAHTDLPPVQNRLRAGSIPAQGITQTVSGCQTLGKAGIGASPVEFRIRAG
jgi:hypothetical protein